MGMQDAITFWDKTAERYARSPIRDMESYEYTLGRTRSYLKQSDDVLEVGCGTGSTALLLAENVRHLTASDLSPNMIAIGKRKAAAKGITNISFVASDVLGDGINRGPYDVVLALNLIHLLQDTPAVMRHFFTLVKPGGHFISKTVCKPGSGTPLRLRLMLAALPLMQWLGKAPFVKFMEIAELEAHVVDAGFEIVETGNHPAAPPNRYIVARRAE